MTEHRVHVAGELFLSIECVAELYQVQTVWLREAYDFGLLGSGVDAGSGLCIAAVLMDRVATIVRLHEALGLGVEAISIELRLQPMAHEEAGLG